MNNLPFELQTEIVKNIQKDVTDVGDLLRRASDAQTIEIAGSLLKTHLHDLWSLTQVSRRLRDVTRPILARIRQYILQDLIQPSPWAYKEAESSGQAAVEALINKLLDDSPYVAFREICKEPNKNLESIEDCLLFPYLDSICRLPKRWHSWAVHNTMPSKPYVFPSPFQLVYAERLKPALKLVKKNEDWSWFKFTAPGDLLKSFADEKSGEKWFLPPWVHYPLKTDPLGWNLDKWILRELRDGEYKGLLALLKAFNPDTAVLRWYRKENRYEIAAKPPAEQQKSKKRKRATASKAAKKEKRVATSKAAKKEKPKKKMTKKGPIKEGNRVEKAGRKQKK
ncbi:uncharacterized protein KY384_000853 [Bacidia gigantensis]|uniref:uncharacterized protein n=1 Tax=Bacidia gigantensis TaxID=2732470 RepID=UPI001D0368EF|nr:uncharacterized protein KY384_000853 [Bacidia gigantensis]KAG8534011.1 hypothetical protein KY384_000853 [Bacidia gigantensis]